MRLTPYCTGGSQALLCSLLRKSQSAFERRADAHLCIGCMVASCEHAFMRRSWEFGVHCVSSSKAQHDYSCECLHLRTKAPTAPSACISGAALTLRTNPVFGCRRQLERQNAEEERASRKVLERLLAERRRHEEVNFEIKLRDEAVKVSWHLQGCAAGCRDAGAISLREDLLVCYSLWPQKNDRRWTRYLSQSSLGEGSADLLCW